MSEPKDGGPAFPMEEWCNSRTSRIEPASPGMSLRDWFAGQALTAMVAGEGARMVADRDERYDETNWAEVVASNAYNFADAMLAARATPGVKPGEGEENENEPR